MWHCPMTKPEGGVTVKEDNVNLITSKQAVVFIMVTQNGVGILYLPSDMAGHAGHDGWIPVIISGVLSLMVSLAIIALCRRFEGQSILDINRIIFGKFISYILNTIFIIYLFLAAISNLGVLASSIGVWFFRSTPLWVLALYIMLPSVYLASKGLKGVCRFNFLIVITIPVLLSSIALNIHNLRLTNLLPVGVHGIDEIAEALPHTLFAYMGFEALLFLFPFIKDKQRIVKHVMIGSITVTLIFTGFVAASIAVFGEDLLAKRIVALVGLARMIEVPVFERVDLYYFAIWIAAMLLAVNAYLFLTFNTVKKVFKIKSKIILLAGIAFIVLVFTSKLSEDADTIFQINHYSGDALFLLGVLYPILLLIITLITGKGVKKT
jgi:spore germination protein (amino acid permease)